jgi:hypothetical protein
VRVSACGVVSENVIFLCDSEEEEEEEEVGR